MACFPCYIPCMANELIPQNSLARAAERVRAKREAERAAGVSEPVAVPLVQKHSAQIRARLNHVPDEETLGGMISNALAALSRGVRWARGSILNLLV
ncbi:MAG: hypothetical protein ACOYNL_09155 [Rickettsiales bacterium]